MITKARLQLDSIQSQLQFGFTNGSSPSLAALVLTELLMDAKDRNNDIYIAFLDTF